MKVFTLYVTFFFLFENHHLLGVNGDSWLVRFFKNLRPPSNSTYGGGNRTYPGDHGDGRGPDGPSMSFPPFIDFVNNTCPVNTNASAPCFFGPPYNQTAGAWVCRTLYDVVKGTADKFSACVDPNHFLATDTCGCCGGSCPSVATCACSCNLPPKSDGGFGQFGGNGYFGPSRGNRNLRSPFGSHPYDTNRTYGSHNDTDWSHNDTNWSHNDTDWSHNDTNWSHNYTNWSHNDTDGDHNGTLPYKPHFNETYGNVTGVLLQVVGHTQTMCVPTNSSYKMITGPGFYGRFQCATTCP